MDFFIVGLVALIASTLTFFSGFGLGTLLLPAFSLFFPVEVAVVLTGIVHFLNNLFKITLVGRNAVWKVVLRFGIPAIIGAVIGARLLLWVSGGDHLLEYQLFGNSYSVLPVNLMIGGLMFLFATLEMSPRYQKLSFSQEKLILGGALSGFFGGLSGHQGALRSAFLIKMGLSKESFIATGVIIASIVDISRLSMYFSGSALGEMEGSINLLLVAVLSAFFGAWVGKRILKKVTIGFVHNMVMILIMIMGIAVGMGIL